MSNCESGDGEQKTTKQEREKKKKETPCGTLNEKKKIEANGFGDGSGGRQEKKWCDCSGARAHKCTNKNCGIRNAEQSQPYVRSRQSGAYKIAKIQLNLCIFLCCAQKPTDAHCTRTMEMKIETERNMALEHSDVLLRTVVPSYIVVHVCFVMFAGTQ